MRRIGFSVALLLVLPLGQAAASWPPGLIFESNVGGGYAMAIDADGELFTVSEGEKAFYLSKYTAWGVPVVSLLTGGGGSFRAPGALAVDADGRVYLADTYASRIQIFDNALKPVGTWERSGWLEYPRDIEIGADGRVYVKTLTEVQVFDHDGEPLLRWPAPGGIFVIEPSGNILTAEQGIFHRYAPDGTRVADLLGTHPFGYPTGLLAYEHVLLVATGEVSVLAFDENGVYRDAFNPGGAKLLSKGPHGWIYVDGLTHYEAPGDLLPPPPPPPPSTGSSAVMLHISPVKDPATACSEGPHSTDEIVTEAAAKADGTARYFVYVLATPRSEEEGLRGVQFGIEHTGSTSAPTDLRIVDWHACSDVEWPNDTWPNSGGGNTLTWVACQFDRLLTVGTFSVTAYAPASMAISGYPATGLVKTANCNAAEETTDETVGLDRVGWVSMGGAARGLDQNGCNPAIESCLAQQVPVRPTTWGRVKSLYGNH